MTFGEKLKEARLAHNLSQLELAEKAGVTERSIYAYEQSGTMPRSAVLKKLADALHVTVTYLLNDGETDKTKKSAVENSDGSEFFIANARNTYGNKGAREAQEVLGKASALFAGGELNDEAKDVFIQSLMEVYLESKAEARAKFAPKRRKSRRQ